MQLRIRCCDRRGRFVGRVAEVHVGPRQFTFDRPAPCIVAGDGATIDTSVIQIDDPQPPEEDAPEWITATVTDEAAERLCARLLRRLGCNETTPRQAIPYCGTWFGAPLSS